jgi:hypothetical protein
MTVDGANDQMRFDAARLRNLLGYPVLAVGGGSDGNGPSKPPSLNQPTERIDRAPYLQSERARRRHGHVRSGNGIPSDPKEGPPQPPPHGRKVQLL